MMVARAPRTTLPSWNRRLFVRWPRRIVASTLVGIVILVSVVTVGMVDRQRARPDADGTATVTVRDDGSLLLDRVPVTPTVLEQRLARREAALPSVHVVVRGDAPNASASDLAKVLRVLAAVSVDHVTFRSGTTTRMEGTQD